MSRLLRDPAAVPALFSLASREAEVQRLSPRTTRRRRVDYAELATLPAVLLVAELPLLRGAAQLLHLALPH